MEIRGPFLDHKKVADKKAAKKAGKRSKLCCWFIDYDASNEAGESKRFRPYFASRGLANAEKLRLQEQYAATGSEGLVLTPSQLSSHHSR